MSLSTAVQETAGRKTPAKITAKKLELEIKDVASSWKGLGVQLNIKLDKIKQIEKEKLGKPPPDESFQSVLQWWLDNTPQPRKRWKAIYEALENVENYRLIRELKEKFDDRNPVELGAGDLSNVLFDVTPKWYEFGECLDVPDTQLKMTENVAGIRACLNAVLKLWLEGSKNEEPYWEDLVDALKRIGNARLARHIQENYLQIKGAEAVPETVETFDPDANVDTSELNDVDHFKEVLVAIMNEPKWYELGLELGLIGPKLEEIKMTNKGDVAECRKYMLMAWLQQRASVDPTWQNLCRALRQPLVGNNMLADNIGQKHPKH